eukprot:9170-Heterococcus_DN1.PRE.3
MEIGRTATGVHTSGVHLSAHNFDLNKLTALLSIVLSSCSNTSANIDRALLLYYMYARHCNFFLASCCIQCCCAAAAVVDAVFVLLLDADATPLSFRT